MIQPEIRYFFSPDVDDFGRYVPPDPERFAFLLQMMIGPQGGPGEESFDVQVVSVGWVAQQVERFGALSGERLLIVGAYDWPAIAAYLRGRVAQSGAEDWRAVATKISGFAEWEFEGYEAP
jgi:Immunity protein 8